MKDNKAISGAAAIYNNAANVNITNSNFTNNNATNGGAGAIFNSGINLTINNSNFIDNSAKSSGGAMLNSGPNFTLINSKFKNNSAGNSGGAIYNPAAGSNLLVINSNFTGNSAVSTGGGIDNVNQNFKLIDSNFINNIAGNAGGAIYNSGNIFNVTNSTFINNTATFGGAIRNDFSTSSIIDNSNFINNTGAYGGAIHTDLYITNFNVTNSNFIGNNATNNGGAIYTNSTTANFNIYNSNFMNNTAANIGGVIYNGGSMNVSGNTMVDNSARLGQMIYNAGNIGILNLTYLNNSTIAVSTGKTVSLFATLTDDMGNTITGKNVTFTLNGTQIGSVTSIEGYVTLSYTVPNTIAIFPVTGDYTGHVNYPINVFGGQLTVKIGTNTTINVPKDIEIGESIDINGVAKDENGNPIANELLNITINSQRLNVTTDSNGGWNLNYILNTINVDFLVSWGGNNTHFGFINTTRFNAKIKTNSTISVSNNAAIGENVNITGVLRDENGNLIANEIIKITINGEIFTTITNSNGAWILDYIPITRNVNVTVSFDGNSYYFGFTNTTNFIAKSITNISIIIPGEVRVGKSVNITGFLTDNLGNPVANARVSIYMGSTIHILTTDSFGQWVLPYKPNHAGVVGIKAIFFENNEYFGSEYITIFNVSKGQINVQVNAIVNPDGSVTITAHATNENGDPIRNHQADFFLNNYFVGHGPTDMNGIAILKIPNNKVSPGKHVVTVIVKGDNDYEDGSNSTEFKKYKKENNDNNEINDNNDKINGENSTNNNNSKNKIKNRNPNNKQIIEIAMKKTGMPSIALLLLLSSICYVIRRKK